MPNKVCSKCKVEKNFEEFGKDRRNKNGLESRCRECRNEDSLIRRQKNPEKNRENYKRWAQNNPEKRREKNRLWAEAVSSNPEARAAKNRRTRECHRMSQRISSSVATVSGRFSPEEDEMVLRTDMTTLEIALRLGRAYSSVNCRRHRLHIREQERENV